MTGGLHCQINKPHKKPLWNGKGRYFI